MINQFLFKPVNNAPLIIFRIILGILITAESFGAIATGWVKRVFIDPQFTFSFIGFEWLQPLEGNGMYYYYVAMGVLGISITIGYKYRWSMLGFAVLWSGVYFMQKTSYNNHYYLLMLIAYLMCFFPANNRLSLDAKRRREIYNAFMPNWCLVLIIGQLWIVYAFGALAKIYPDWLSGEALRILMSFKSDYYLIGPLLQTKGLQLFLTYGGILFDAFVIPLLLFKTTRKLAIGCSIFFHLFNAIVFQIGIFPFLSLGFLLFFINPKKIEKCFIKNKITTQKKHTHTTNRNLTIKIAVGTYLLIQLLLPLRHWFIKDDVLWTEEGHRMSWRMMLRTKTGICQIQIFNHTYNHFFNVDLNKYLTAKQQKNLATKPDFIWQFAQRLKSIYKKKGDRISVYAKCKVSVNESAYKTFINPDTDLAAVPWNYFWHNPWILPSKAP